MYKCFLWAEGWYIHRSYNVKSNFHIYNFSAPDKNPQNIRVQASTQGNDYQMGGEDSLCFTYYLCILFTLLGPHPKYNDRTISFKNRWKLFIYFINIFYFVCFKKSLWLECCKIEFNCGR